jgi:sugar phosphate isomerase/epimerase
VVVVSAPTLAISTSFRPPAELGPDRIVRLASEAGFEGIAAGKDMTLELLKLVAGEALRAGLRMSLAVCPLPMAGLAKNKRLPWLASNGDPDERRAAVKAGIETLAFGQQLGITNFVVDLGQVALRTQKTGLELGYARREMAGDEPGGRFRRRALEERNARGLAILDSCRLGLEPLLADAERRGATLALQLATSPWQVPTPREAHHLLRDLAGGPLSLVYSPARREVLADLGLAGPAERWGDLIGAATVVEFADRVGLRTDLCLGTGELPPGLPAGMVRAQAGVVRGPIDSTFREVLRAAKRARDELIAATAEPPK